ncbi:MAG: hypothetical protein HRU18_01220 [Pseudoalteromonas sp.]|uniref:hypothetical protein n=1 Tax=Pseudoalteromonas sp. TaxID=53249 RepID=UPI001DB630DA|nr:hypothetical protein [Pseudoalteromonas sp.]NRA76800.1 hypothetical protein [Pseudoalteromonas sp.]
MSKPYYSNASWTKIDNSKDKHYDNSLHTGLEVARAICKRLLQDYGHGTRGCDIRGHCTGVWITDEDGNKVDSQGNKV